MKEKANFENGVVLTHDENYINANMKAYDNYLLTDNFFCCR